MPRFSRSHRLSVQPVALCLAVALVVPTTAFAANTTTGYNQTPPTPTMTGYNQTPPTPTTTGYNQTPPTPTTGASPSAGTSPSKETSTPTTTTAPTTTNNAPTTTTTPAKSATASTLPFTGLDLRWTVGIGLLLMGMGFSIVTVQRRQRR
jgi:hypothetical protein